MCQLTWCNSLGSVTFVFSIKSQSQTAQSLIGHLLTFSWSRSSPPLLSVLLFSFFFFFVLFLPTPTRSFLSSQTFNDFRFTCLTDGNRWSLIEACQRVDRESFQRRVLSSTSNNSFARSLFKGFHKSHKLAFGLLPSPARRPNTPL